MQDTLPHRQRERRGGGVGARYKWREKESVLTVRREGEREEGERGRGGCSII